MILKLPFTVREESWYPHGRAFTEFEARIDLLLLLPEGSVDARALAHRWKWSEADATTMLKTVLDSHESTDWYIEEETATTRKKRAKEVIDLFNMVFGRNIQLNEYRIRTINARIKEGKSLRPRIGIDQFRAVFEFKKKDWKDTEMEKHLDIETLCAQKHFLKYLEGARLDYLNKQKVKKTEEEGVRFDGALFKP